MLKPAQSKYLRAQAHPLNPTLTIGNKGVTDAVANEAEVALTAHELIKVKLPAVDKDEKKALLADLCAKSQAEQVQLIGRVGVIFRAKQSSGQSSGRPSRFSLPE